MADLVGSSSTLPELRLPEKQFQNPPQFSELFHDTIVEEGKAVKLECSVTGSKMHIQWYKDGVLLNAIEYDIRNQGDKQILSIPYAKLRDGGRYVCQADNIQGKATCSAQLTVKPTDKKEEPIHPQYPVFEKTFVRESPELRPLQPLEIIDTIEQHEKITETFSRPVVSPQPPITMPKPVTVPVVPKKWVPPSQSMHEKTTARVEQTLNLAPVLPDMKPIYEKPEICNVAHIGKIPAREEVPPITWNVQQKQQTSLVKTRTEFLPSAPSKSACISVAVVLNVGM